MKEHIKHAWHGGLPTLAAIEKFESEKPLAKRIPATVYELFVTAAQKYGEKTALTMIMTGEQDENPVSLSYAELLKKINQTANLFAEVAGAGAGVAYIMPTLLETQITLWAAETSGFAVPLNPLLNAEHLADLLETSQAKALVVPGPDIAPQIWEKIGAIRMRCPDIKVIVVSKEDSKDKSNTVNFHASTMLQSDQKLTFSLPEHPDRVVAYFHTGGTTSAPKLVAHTHVNQLAAALGAAALLDIRSTDIQTNGMPMFHVGGAIVSSLAFFLAGATVLIMSPAGFRNPAMVEHYWRIVELYKVTVLGAVPTALAAILEYPASSDLSQVRIAMTGSAATPTTLAKQFTQQTGLFLHEILGMTESGGATAIDPAGAEATIGCVGLRLPYTNLAIHKHLPNGELGEICAANEIGVLIVSGPTVSPGYLQAAQEDNSFIDEHLNSGDLGYLNAEGKLFLSGRSKDLIIRGGHNIDPVMIEEVLASHPSVASAAAVGQPDSYAGERPVCYVTLRPNKSATTEELLSFAQQGISERPAWPCAIRILNELPLTAVGKIYKPALHADAALHVIKPLVAEVAGAALLNINLIDNGAKGLTIVAQLSNFDIVEPVTEVLGRFTIASRVEVDTDCNT